jgi:CDP-glucose 4,6-dehydratase
VFVTGHTGFKGSWLCLWLARLGARTVGYSDGVPTEPSLYDVARVGETLTSIVGDVRNGPQLGRAVAEHQPEVVFHLAAQPLVRRSYADPVLTFETNVLGTVNLLEAVRRVETARAVVVVTTDKVYEHRAPRRHREGDPLGGTDPYSSSKACAELAVAAYRASFFTGETSPAVATVRAGNVIGGGDWAQDRLVPDLVGALMASRTVEIRYPDAIRPWQHVLNPLDGYLRLAERMWADPDLSRGWNFGPADSETRSVAWLIGRFSALWGSDLRTVSPSEPQPPEVPTLELDPSQARDRLGWTESWALEQGLVATVDWYRRHAAGEDARALTAEQIDAFSAERRDPPRQA